MTIYAVNGKEPVAAWIPSLDTAGNGTTTLTDLVGSAHGTLTNMDAATDWVADTNAGGVRALDFDGSNDVVNATIASLANPFSISCWNSIDGFPNSFPMWFGGGNLILGVAMTLNGGAAFYAGGQYFSARYFNVSNVWQHIVYTSDGTNIRLYLNGSLQDTKAFTAGSITAVTIGKANVYPFRGRLDDIRLFGAVLDTTDIAYLYDSGSGRGIVSGATAPARRRVSSQQLVRSAF